MTAAEEVIQVEGLTKSYGSLRGVEEVSFSVRRGEIFGFLGPNGAGKTTCIRLLLDLLKPDRGRIAILGADIARDRWRFKERIGNLPGEVAWWPGLAGREILDFLGRFRSGPPALRKDLLDALDLDEVVLRRKVGTYSRGMKKKLGLVAAMQHDPDLLILDEPFSGLDPLVRRVFFTACRRFRERGKTIFLSSHNLAETGEICDRAGVIFEGRLVAVESMAELEEKSPRRVEVLFRTPVRPRDLRLPGVEVVRIEGNRAHLTSRGDPAPLLAALAEKRPRDLTIVPPGLDDLFFRSLGKNLPAEGKEDSPPPREADPGRERP